MMNDKQPGSLILICGHSFAGKTTLGERIAACFGYPQIDVDVTKCDLYGTAIQDDELTQSDWDRIYAESDARMLAQLKAGHWLIDASRHFQRYERDQTRQLLQSIGAEEVLIYLDTPESVVRQRWQQNGLRPTRRQPSPSDFESVIAAMQAPDSDEQALLFHYQDDIDGWIERHRELLEQSR